VAVLILLILVDLAVVGIIMWAVVREPHRELKGNHPFVVAERDAAAKLKAVEPAAPPVESDTAEG
jgi:hypothetical protein